MSGIGQDQCLAGEMQNVVPPTRISHLYVMQVERGQIKIGRSIDVEKRRRALETGSGRKVFLIATLEGRGHEECAVHQALARFRNIGEWFSGSKEAKAAIQRVLGVSLQFPYPACTPEAKKIRKNRKEAEMDAMLERALYRIRTGKRYRSPEELAEIKRRTEALEARWARQAEKKAEKKAAKEAAKRAAMSST